MMNGEVPSVPITTLAGITSLTDLLPQLPLPTPLPNAVSNKSLLYHPKLAADAQRLLASGDDALVAQLIAALKQTTTDHIELKDSLVGDSIEGEVPNLLRGILATDPQTFRGNKSHGTSSKHSKSQSVSPYGQSARFSKQSSSTACPGPSSPRSQQPQPSSSGAVQSKSSTKGFQQQFLAFSQDPQTSGTVNGEHASLSESVSQPKSSRSRQQRNSGPVVSSPAQASVAETVSTSQSRLPDTRGMCEIPGSVITPEDFVRRSTRVHTASVSDSVLSKQNTPPSKQSPVGTSYSKDHSSVNKSPKTSSGKEPVVLLEHLDPKNISKESSRSKSSGMMKGPMVVLKPLDSRTLKSIASGGTVRTELSRDRRGSKRKYNDDVISIDDDEDYRPSLTERIKRRRRHSSQREYEDVIDLDAMSEEEYQVDPELEALRKRKKEKRQKRANQSALSSDELFENPTFKKFGSAVEYIFDSSEDINFGSLDPNDEEVECPPESLISKSVLSELVGETAKLKTLGVLNEVPADKLVKLLTILQWNIRDGTKLLPNMAQENDDEDEHEQKIWRELTMERVTRSMDAALTAMYIMTAPNMPKQVYLEDVIERVIMFGKFQLQNTIFPEFDPVYRVDPKQKDGYHPSYKLKRARAGQVKHKSTITLYNKMSDMVGNLAELVEIQELTDTIILQVSTLGVSSFFVENVSELQLNAMKVVTTVFAYYDKHRQLILEDIFASLARLPSSKRNLRNYRLNADESIQMVTALALQLIQCVVRLPQPESDSQPSSPAPAEEEVQPKSSSRRNCASSRNPERSSAANKTADDVVIVTSYETAMRTGHNFLSVFLKKCTMKGEEDYRPLFENFVQDLLSTVNKPEWPASELLLSLLGKILVHQFSNRSVDMSLRVASLEYLGIVAARLRKDAVSSHLNQETIDEIVQKVNDESGGEEEDDEVVRKSTRRNSGKQSPVPKVEDKTQDLQKSMLDYLAYNGQNEPAYLFARQFYIAQWYRDSTVEAEKKLKTPEEEEFEETLAEKTTETFHNAERRKNFLLSQVETNYRPFSTFHPSPSKLDYNSACLVARYLSSKRPFAQSFDIYLSQILKVLSENAVAVRTKAMKCLTAVVEADPGILARTDMERGVHGRFLDQSTSVREAAVELVGKFILIRPELIPQYYNMLSDRILDTGISVRKRVIKIFRDIFVEHSDFEKIPDMCVKMIRRVNDEEGIKKLVNEVFQSMWFTPLSTRDKDSAKLLQRVVNITEVVAASKHTGYEFIEQLLDNLLKKDEHGNYNKSALTACRQIVDCLVENVLRLEEISAEGKGCSQRLMACLSTLYLFSKIKPDLMVEHATTLQPYLDIKCSNSGDYWVLHYVARILEMAVPLMDHPSESFLAQLEEDMMKLILKHGMMVLQSCVSCLGAVVNSVSHNYALVKDCFQKFFGVLSKMMAEHKRDPDCQYLKTRKPTLLRSLFTVGLFCKHFDFDSKDMGEIKKMSVRDRVFDVLEYFATHEDEDVRDKALTGLGFMAVRHYEMMLGRTLKELYSYLLTHEDASVKLKCQVLKNLQNYLTEEEIKMAKADAEWRKHAKEEDLRDMGDVQSGMASTIMQIYLKQVLEAYFTSNNTVRLESLHVIHLVLRQGLIHPVPVVPYLISMGTDSEPQIRIKADQQLQEIEKKYPGFIHMKALQGIKMSYRLQEILQMEKNGGIVRGLREHSENHYQSLNAFLYTVLRTNRSHRRAILLSLLNLFDDCARISLAEQVYIADNLAFFAYQTQDEPLFIIHQIDIIVSVSGSNLLQSFKERMVSVNGNCQAEERALPVPVENGITPETNRRFIDDDDDEDEETLLARLPEDISPLKEICRLSQGCILLLYVKQHLKDLYGFTDSKIQNYSPTEAAKVYDKPLQRKAIVAFNPECVLNVLKADNEKESRSREQERRKLVNDYLEFKDLMLSIDPPDDDDSDEAKSTGRQTPTPGKAKPIVDGVQEMVDGEVQDKPTVIEIDGEDGETEAANPTEKINSEETTIKLKPATPVNATITPSRHSHHNASSRDRDRKRSHHRSIRLPGSAIPQPISQSHSHSSHSHSHSHHTPKSAPPKKKKAKRRKRYGSDSDDDDDSDYDPDFR